VSAAWLAILPPKCPGVTSVARY